jgi:DNA-binding MarR family transcriptional regulator
MPTRTASDHAAIADGLDRFLMWARRKAPAQMSTTRITTLDTLAWAGPLRISELASREAMTQPGMTALVNRLAEDGYAERVDDPTDRRATLVRITPAGERVLADRHAARTAALLTDIRRLPDEHRRALAAAVDALHALTTTTSTEKSTPA